MGDVVVELGLEVAGQPAPRLPRQQRQRPVVLERSIARDVWCSLPLSQPGLREHQHITPNGHLRQLIDTA